MKKKCKPNMYTWCIVSLFCGIGLFFSCTDSEYWKKIEPPKEKIKKSKNKNEELTIAVAQQWYQSNYAPIVTTRSNMTDSTRNLLMMLSWDKAKESNRRRYEVVEIPIRTKRAHILLDAETAREWQPNAPAKFIRNTAKIVVERDKKTEKTRSFMMVFIGSYNYLKTTRTMGKNTYLYRQPDFDGMVLFYELNGVLINGWKYTNGKITGSISPKTGNDDKVISKVETRAWVKDCYTDYVYESKEVCEDEVSIEYDNEFGESWVVTRNCWDDGNWVPIIICEEYWEDDKKEDEDDNWEEDYPSGGSNTPGDTNNDNPVDSKQQQLEQALKGVEALLKTMGIDISKYNIQVNADICMSTARTLQDGTIEVCDMFFKYNSKEQSSIIWHEIYHSTHGHNNTSSEYIPLSDTDWIHLTPDKTISEYIDCFLRWKNKDLGAQLDYFLPGLKDIELTQTSLRSEQWYKNEIETYTAELNNGIEKSDYYYAELQYMLWAHKQMYEYVKSKKQQP